MVGDCDLVRILSRLGMRASLDGVVPRDTLSTSVTSRPHLDEVALSLRDGLLGFPSTLASRLAPSCCCEEETVLGAVVPVCLAVSLLGWGRKVVPEGCDELDEVVRKPPPPHRCL